MIELFVSDDYYYSNDRRVRSFIRLFILSIFVDDHSFVRSFGLVSSLLHINIRSGVSATTMMSCISCGI